MADKPAKQKGKAKREQPSVLGTLPATRPERIGRPRDGGPSRTKRESPRTTAAATTTRTRRATATASAKTAPARSKRETPKPAPARPAASRRNGSGAKPAPVAHHGPTAVKRGSPSLEPHRATDSPPPRSVAAPTGTELVTTTIRAAGELAQIGLTVGGQVLKRAVDRIPKP